MSRILHLRADDAGLSPGTNAAIHAATVVCPNIGLIAVAPALSDAADRFRSLHNLCLGLHFTLNAEWANLRWGPAAPTSDVPSLIQPDGTFYPNPWQLPDGVVYQAEEVELELRAQLARLRALGLTIRYLDAHMACLNIRPDLQDLARRFADAEGLRYVDPLPKFRHGPYGPDLDQNLARWDQLLADQHPSPALAIFHPASADGVLEHLSPDPTMATTRQAEAALLTSPRFRELLKKHQTISARFAA